MLEEMRGLGIQVDPLPALTPLLRLGTVSGVSNALLWMTQAEIDALPVNWLPGSPSEAWQAEPDAGVLTEWDMTAPLESTRRGPERNGPRNYAAFDNKANRPVTRQHIESWVGQLPGLILASVFEVIAAQQDVRADVDEASRVLNAAVEGSRRERSASDNRVDDRNERDRRVELRSGDVQRRLIYPELMPYQQPPTRRVADE